MIFLLISLFFLFDPYMLLSFCINSNISLTLLIFVLRTWHNSWTSCKRDHDTDTMNRSVFVCDAESCLSHCIRYNPLREKGKLLTPLFARTWRGEGWGCLDTADDWVVDERDSDRSGPDSPTPSTSTFLASSVGA